MTSLGIGVIGARSMVAERALLPAIDRSEMTHLAAVCSLGGPPRGPVGDAVVTTGYQEVLDHPSVEAVYIPLPNHLHAEWTERAATAGKHVLCEKPLAPDGTSARRMIDACADAGVLLAEAWMTPFATRWQTALDLIESGRIGPLERIDAAFTFTIGPEHQRNYRWHPDQGGGALLDVGVYCLGPAIQLWGSTPDDLDVRQRCVGGVDATTTIVARWGGERTLRARCSFVEAERQALSYTGPLGTIALVDEAHTGGRGAGAIDITNDAGTTRLVTPSNDPYQAMLEGFVAAIRGEREWPRPIRRSQEMLALFDRIRAAARPLENSP